MKHLGFFTNPVYTGSRTKTGERPYFIYQLPQRSGAITAITKITFMPFLP